MKKFKVEYKGEISIFYTKDIKDLEDGILKGAKIKEVNMEDTS